MTTYTAHYPSPIDGSTVTANSTLGGENQLPPYAVDPALSLIGSATATSWLSANDGSTAPRCINIDYGTAFIPRRLVLENYHHLGAYTSRGVKNVSVYGHNSATAFAATDPSDTTDCDLLGTFLADVHISADSADPQEFLLEVDATYRYIKIIPADTHGDSYMGIRLVVVFSEDGFDPGGNTSLRAWTVMDYTLSAAIRAHADIDYALLFDRRAYAEMLYSIRLGAHLTMYYGDCPVLRGATAMYYGDCPILRRGLVMPYGDLLGHRAWTHMDYSLPAALRAAMEMRYAIAADALRVYVDMQYALMDVNALRASVAMPYLMQGDGMYRQVDVVATIGGRTVRCNHLSIEPSWDNYVITAELHLVREADYQQVAEGEDLIITLDGTTYQLIVEDKRDIRSERGTITWIVTGISPAARLTAPWSRPQLQAFAGGTAHQIITDLVADTVPLQINIDDFPVLADTLYANDEDALAIIRKLIAAVGAILQSDPDGTLRIEYEEPADFETRAPDYYISAERNFISADNTRIETPGYNRYLVGNQLSSDNRTWAEARDISATVKEVLGFRTPWTLDPPLRLRHSGGEWVTPPEYLGIVNELYPPLTEDPEQVEFVAGYANAARPIYGPPSVVWIREQLGVITYAEDGRLEAEVKDGPTEGYSLAEIRYPTRYHRWRVRNERDETVQYLLEEVE